MTLLVSVVFRDVVEIVTADDDCAVHFCRNHTAREDAAADGDEAGEGALLVCPGVSPGGCGFLGRWVGLPM